MNALPDRAKVAVMGTAVRVANLVDLAKRAGKAMIVRGLQLYIQKPGKIDCWCNAVVAIS